MMLNGKGRPIFIARDAGTPGQKRKLPYDRYFFICPGRYIYSSGTVPGLSRDSTQNRQGRLLMADFARCRTSGNNALLISARAADRRN
jgi:hypothetical protein